MSKVTKVTMSHIAARSGVSQSTVSLVLNHSHNIKLAAATREKVLTTAREMGYVRKSSASVAGMGKIALLFNGVLHRDPFAEAIYSAQQAAWQHNKLLAIFEQKNEPGHCAALEEEIRRGGYQGIIYASSLTTALTPVYFNFAIPMVMLNGYCPELPDIPCILPAEKVSAYKATCHLLQQGYKRIAMLVGERKMAFATDRLYGYRQALINHDIFPDERYIRVANGSLKVAYQKTLDLLLISPPPDAIFCSSDDIAIGCYQAILSRGLRIPDDIAVVGYSNQRLSPALTPELSAVELSWSKMGVLALTTLLKLSNRQPLLDTIMKVEGELVVRASSVRPCDAPA